MACGRSWLPCRSHRVIPASICDRCGDRPTGLDRCECVLASTESSSKSTTISKKYALRASATEAQSIGISSNAAPTVHEETRKAPPTNKSLQPTPPSGRSG